MKNKIVKDTLALTVITLVSGLLLGLVNDITAVEDSIRLQASRRKRKKRHIRQYLLMQPASRQLQAVRIRIWKAIWMKTVSKLRILMKSCWQRMTREMNLAMPLP